MNLLTLRYTCRAVKTEKWRLIILSSCYSWFNYIHYWNPYFLPLRICMYLWCQAQKEEGDVARRLHQNKSIFIHIVEHTSSAYPPPSISTHNFPRREGRIKRSWGAELVLRILFDGVKRIFILIVIIKRLRALLYALSRKCLIDMFLKKLRWLIKNSSNHKYVCTYM